MKLSNIWENFDEFISKAKIAGCNYTGWIEDIKADRRPNKLVIIGSLFNEILADFPKLSKVFDYTPDEFKTVKDAIESKPEVILNGIFAKNLNKCHSGILLNQEQLKTKFVRAEAAEGLMKVGSNNSRRPHYCTITDLPGYNNSNIEIGGIYNTTAFHGSLDQSQQWYIMLHVNLTPGNGNIRIKKKFDFKDIDEAKNFMKSYLTNVLYTDKFPQIKDAIIERFALKPALKVQEI